MLIALAFALGYDGGSAVGRSISTSACSVGHKDYAMGTIQYSKHLLQILSVVFYARKPHISPRHAWWRHASLTFILFLSWVVACLSVFTDLYRPTGNSMLIFRALDQEIAEDASQIVHVSVVCLLGLLEKLLPPRHAAMDPPNERAN